MLIKENLQIYSKSHFRLSIWFSKEISFSTFFHLEIYTTSHLQIYKHSHLQIYAPSHLGVYVPLHFNCQYRKDLRSPSKYNRKVLVGLETSSLFLTKCSSRSAPVQPSHATENFKFKRKLDWIDEENESNFSIDHHLFLSRSLLLPSLVAFLGLVFPWQLSLPPATKLGQGNIFRSVCQEFCSQGGLQPKPRGEVEGCGRGVSRPTHEGVSWGVWLGGVSRSRPRGAVSQYALRQTLPSRRLLLRAVSILLECILACSDFTEELNTKPYMYKGVCGKMPVGFPL